MFRIAGRRVDLLRAGGPTQARFWLEWGLPIGAIVPCSSPFVIEWKIVIDHAKRDASEIVKHLRPLALYPFPGAPKILQLC